jgi:hypothetical protein
MPIKQANLIGLAALISMLDSEIAEIVQKAAIRSDGTIL